MTQKADGRWEMTSYDLLTVSEEIEADAATQEKVDALIDMVDSVYLELFGLKKDQVLAANDKTPVDVAVVPAGVIRDTYAKGNITTENVFNSFSLGIGEDGVPGYPLISVYLTGEELKLVAEIDSSVSDVMKMQLS